MRLAVLVGVLALGCGADDGAGEDAPYGYLGDHCDQNKECGGLSEDLAGRQVASCVASVCTFTCNTKDQVKACTELGGTCFGECQLQ